MHDHEIDLKQGVIEKNLRNILVLDLNWAKHVSRFGQNMIFIVSRFVMIQLFFAAKWILISEVTFESGQFFS